MVKTLGWVFALVILLYAVPVAAETGRCLLRVDGKTFLKGSCEIVNQHDHGSFSVGAGPMNHSAYFAYVLMQDGVAHGYWNATPSASHAHDDLGVLARRGACWVNSRARVCAYR